MQSTRYHYSTVQHKGAQCASAGLYVCLLGQYTHTCLCANSGTFWEAVLHDVCTVCIVSVCMHSHSVGAALRCIWYKILRNTGIKNTLLLPTQRYINKNSFFMCPYYFLLLVKRHKVVSIVISRTRWDIHTDINILDRLLGVAFYLTRNFQCKIFMYNWTVEHWD